MALTNLDYVPVLKWRQGEYQALLRLRSDHKQWVVPLIEITPPEFDFETRQLKKSIDDHLGTFAKRLAEKWGTRSALIDANLLGENLRMEGGLHPLRYLMDACRSSCNVIPVTGLSRDEEYQEAVRSACLIDESGAVLRCSLEEAVEESFDANVAATLRRIGVEIGEAHIVLDLRAPNFDPLDGLAALIHHTLGASAAFRRSRSLTIVASSFPESMAEVKGPTTFWKRKEWLLYKEIVRTLPEGRRRPGFGDYCIAHPNLPQIDMRLVKPSATIRYAVHDGWLIAKGPNVRDNGFSQYRGLCGTITGSASYLGADFSEGSRYIRDCEQKRESTGQLSTWRWVGTNHHMTKVVRDLSSFLAL